MVIFMKHSGETIYEGLLYNTREYESLGDLLKDVIDRHNKLTPYFKIKPSDIYIKPSIDGDERIGWHDHFMLVYQSYDNCSNKEGYDRYFGGDRSSYPCGVIGYFSTDYEQKWTKEELEQIVEGMYK